MAIVRRPETIGWRITMVYRSSPGHPRSAAISVIWRDWEAGLHSFTLTTSLLIPSHTHKLIVPNKGADYFINTPLLTSCQPPPTHTHTYTYILRHALCKRCFHTFWVESRSSCRCFCLDRLWWGQLLFRLPELKLFFRRVHLSSHGPRCLRRNNVRMPTFCCPV